MGADVVVVGAGLSGVACARELRAAGLDTRVLDRGRVPGGRMAARTLWDRRVDLGASYLTVERPRVRRRRRRLGRARAGPRVDRHVHGAGRRRAGRARPGPVRWGAPDGLRSLVEDLAADLAVERREVPSVGGARRGRAVVLAMPDPQARRLWATTRSATSCDREWEPVIARGRPVVRAHVGRRQPDRPLRRGLRQRRPRRRLDRRRRPAPRRRRPGAGRPLDARAGRAPPRRPGRRRARGAAGRPGTARPRRARRTSTSTAGPSPARRVGARRPTPSSTATARSGCAATGGARRPRSRPPGSPAYGSGVRSPRGSRSQRVRHLGRKPEHMTRRCSMTPSPR